MEMDFLIQRDGVLLPIEVKGGTSVKATSLHHYLLEHPDISAIRYSMLPYRQQANITNMPLYGVFLNELQYGQFELRFPYTIGRLIPLIF